MDSITLSGRLTRDPEIRYTTEGHACARLRVQTAGGHVDLMAWRDLAENIALSLRIGDRVVVTGEVREAERDEDDERLGDTYLEVVVDDLGPSLRFATTDVMRLEYRGKREEKG